MNIYTSYWAMVRNFPRNLVGLNTTVWPPKWRPLGKDKNGVIVIDCPPFKPGASCNRLCHGSCNPKYPDTCSFLKEYRRQLDKMDTDKFLNNLARLANEIKSDEALDDIDFALIVFEKWDNPCSERVAIQSWGKSVGIDIREWSR